MKKLFFIAVALMAFATMSFAQVCNYDPQTGIIKIYKDFPGAISGKFTINASGDKVLFSKGNLQYKASANAWRFAEHQWDYVGNASLGNVYENAVKCNNLSGSSSYSGWIDLFGWGTSGYHNPSDTYNTQYTPYALSTTNVNTTYNSYGFGPSTNIGGGNLTGTNANYDWGVYHSDDLGEGWRTLTKDEWNYLFNTRTASSVAGNANARFVKAYLFGAVHGVIIFPDVYTHPEGVSNPENINYTGGSWSANQYTLDDWRKMEAEGCVFLPAGGFRSGMPIAVNNVQEYGFYWSSTYKDSGEAYLLFFAQNNGLNAAAADRRYGGFSVRLVHAAPTR